MNGKLAVDTNAFIAFATGEPGVVGLLGEAEAVYLPSIALGEMLFGAANSGRAERNRELVLGFAAGCVLLEVTAAVAARYAAARLALRRKGRPIPENDLWIAAACLEAGVPLLTADAHFTRVEGLDVRRWEPAAAAHEEWVVGHHRRILDS